MWTKWLFSALVLFVCSCSSRPSVATCKTDLPQGVRQPPRRKCRREVNPYALSPVLLGLPLPIPFSFSFSSSFLLLLMLFLLLLMFFFFFVSYHRHLFLLLHFFLLSLFSYPLPPPPLLLASRRPWVYCHSGRPAQSIRREVPAGP